MVRPRPGDLWRTIQTLLRIVGVALVIVAAIRFIIDATSSMQSEEHPTANGFVIQHRIEIPHTTIAVGVAGVVLFAISFIRAPNAA